MWLFQRTTPESVGEIRAASRLARGPRVVAVGGGNGLAALLRGLKTHTSNLTAVVTMADDGGSSGMLRRDMGMPPPGDLRNCLVALADDESMMSQLFKYRFPADGGLQGHSFGNLFITALAEVSGDFEHAVREATHVLRVRGRVLPSTLDDVVLHAQLEGGERVSGESSITAAERLPRRVWLTPEAPRGVPQAVAAIARADLVVLGPGSLYTSVIPNALVPEVREALRGLARLGRLRVQRHDRSRARPTATRPATTSTRCTGTGWRGSWTRSSSTTGRSRRPWCAATSASGRVRSSSTTTGSRRWASRSCARRSPRRATWCATTRSASRRRSCGS